MVSLAALLVIPLAFGEWLDLPEIYWRIVVAVAILAAVGTAVIPLVNLLFAPKKPQPQPMAYGYGQAAIPAGPYAPAEAQSQTPAYAPAPPSAPEPAAQELLPWPTYVDGATPLPMLPDGSPDWNAYYTGYPTPGAHVFAPADAAAQAPSASEQAPEPPVSPQAPTAPSGYEGYPPPPPLPPRS